MVFLRRRWAAEGHIVRTLDPSGRSVITAASPSVHPTSSVNNIVAVHKSSRSLATAANADAHLIKQCERPLLGVVPPRSMILRRTLSVGFMALASTITWFGIRINAWYGGLWVGPPRRAGSSRASVCQPMF
jgi:hypothetical protein